MTTAKGERSSPAVTELLPVSIQVAANEEEKTSEW